MMDALPPGSENSLASDGEISRLARSHGLDTFSDAVHHVRSLPYERISDRSDYRLVLGESRGTCSTKHALLAALARENGLAVSLVLGIYEMTDANTPGIGDALSKYGLSSIPEAHCYLRTGQGVIDATTEASSDSAERHFLHEETITPEDIGAYKNAVHRRVLDSWLRATDRATLGLDAAWAAREDCIAALSRSAVGTGMGGRAGVARATAGARDENATELP